MTTLSLERERLMIQFKRYQSDARTPLRTYPDSAGYHLYANETKLLLVTGKVRVSVDLNLLFQKVFLDKSPVDQV